MIKNIIIGLGITKAIAATTQAKERYTALACQQQNRKISHYLII